MASARRKTILCPGGLAICAAYLAGGVFIPDRTEAQVRTPAPPAVVTGDLTRRDVRVGADVPNISGVWVALSSNRSTPPYDGGATPFLPWAQAYFDRRGEAERNGQPLFDPSANCLPGGVPRIISSPYPIDIVQTPTLTMISTETLHEARMIHMDGKPMPADFKPSYFGYSVGRWEGDTLVVETTGLSPYTQVDEEGRPKSKDMKVVERYQKHTPNLLEVTYTLYDPRTYSRPWTVQARFRWAPEMSLGEYICEENNRNKPDPTGKLRHGSEKK